MDTDREPARRFACRQLWSDLSISWDGRVTVCCKDVFYKLEVGDAGKTPLSELWRSKRWEALRKAHRNGVYTMRPCDECKEWYV